MERRKRKRKRVRAGDEGAYVCPSCGERVVIPIDVSGGGEQEYVEDCPVCCNPNVSRVEWMGEGEEARVWAKGEGEGGGGGVGGGGEGAIGNRELHIGGGNVERSTLKVER